MAILNSLNAHSLSIFQPILMILYQNSWIIEFFLINYTYHRIAVPFNHCHANNFIYYTPIPHFILSTCNIPVVSEWKTVWILTTWFCQTPANQDLYFLAHLSHWLMVSYCDRWMSVVRRPSCVVNNCFKRLLLLNYWLDLTKLGRNDPYMTLF